MRRLSYLFGALIAGVVGFACLELAYRFYDLKNHLAQTLKTADLETDSEIRKKVADRVKRYGVQCIEQDIVVTRGAGRVVVDVPYRQEIQVAALGRRYTLLSVVIRAEVERDF